MYRNRAETAYNEAEGSVQIIVICTLRYNRFLYNINIFIKNFRHIFVNGGLVVRAYT